jgi:hypothetical protein
MSNNIKVGFSATDAGYTSTVKKINDSTKTIDDNVKKVSGSVTSSFASMIKAGAGLAVGFGAIKAAGALVREVFEGFGEALDLGGQLKDLSDRTGESAGNLMLLQRAFENTGSSAEKVGPSINKLQKFMDDAAQGGKSQTETLSRLGISLEELKGKTPIEQMQVFAERISAVEIDAERSALAIKVFGKSGGELLPLLRNMSGELETAKGQLGSMPDIMTRFNKVFDDVSDNITIIKGKFMEFAAGLLSKLAPALEFVTTMMTRFDAAALGMRLGEIITGAGNGIAAFSDALKSISFGDFEGAWKIAFTAIKLTAAEAINSIYANMKGLFAAIGVMLEQSGIAIIFESLFNGIANKMTSALRGAIADFLDAIGKVSAAEEMRLFSKADEDRANNYFQIAKAGFASLGENAAAALDPMSKAYDKARDSAGQLINTSGMQAQLDRERAALQEKIAADKSKEAKETDNVVKKQHEGATIQEKIAAINENIVELETAIVQAKQEGNKQREVELGKQKAYFEELKRSLELGLSESEAIKNATKARADYVKDIASSQREVTAELQKQLSLSQQMQGDLDKRAAEEQVDPGGRTRSKFEQAMEAGNFSKAQREADKMVGKETEAATKKLFSDFKRQQKLDKETEGFGWNYKDAEREAEKEQKRAMRMSPIDMAKELGLETSGKKRWKLIDEIKEELEKRKEKDKPGKEGEKEPAKPEKNQDPNTGVLESILTEVTGIGKKLPVTALGY